MAEIFYAERHGAMSFRRPVCIKRIRPTLSADSSFVQMFIDEAHTTSKLRHSNIVAVEDFGSEDGQLFLCMEWIHGLDGARLLREVDRSGTLLPVDAALHIIGEVLKALEYAHRKSEGGKALQIIHRDVSPHNVMVSFAGEVKLTDFGIAKAASRLHQTQGDMVKGKIAYMAPEQAIGGVLDGRADLFAVGVMAFEFLTGRRPFTGKELELVQSLLRGDRPRVRDLRPEVSPEVEAFVDGLLQVQRDRRFADASHALEALQLLPVATGGRSLQRVIAGLYPDQVSVVSPSARGSLPEAIAAALATSADMAAEATVPARRVVPEVAPAAASAAIPVRPNNEPTRTVPAQLPAPYPATNAGPPPAGPGLSKGTMAAVVLASMAITAVVILAVVKERPPRPTPGVVGTRVIPVAHGAEVVPQGPTRVAAAVDAGGGVAAAAAVEPRVDAGVAAAVDAGGRPAPQWANVVLRARPWGDVTVGGRRVGNEPVRLRPGVHQVVVTQGERQFRQSISLRPGQTGTYWVNTAGR